VVLLIQTACIMQGVELCYKSQENGHASDKTIRLPDQPDARTARRPLELQSLTWASRPDPKSLGACSTRSSDSAPCVIALGAIFRRMFSSHRTLCAIAAMSIALVAESTATLFPPASWELVVLPFLFGPAAVAYLLDLLRSNSRSSTP
jgi:hypothetical protein